MGSLAGWKDAIGLDVSSATSLVATPPSPAPALWLRLLSPGSQRQRPRQSLRLIALLKSSAESAPGEGSGVSLGDLISLPGLSRARA